MSSLAVALVVVAGLLHASWNFVAKKVGGDLRFAALSSLFMVAIWAPFVLPTAVREVPTWGFAEWACVLGSTAFHVPYFFFLLRGYRSADLTVVYPVARGSGPLLTAAVAIAAFGERLTVATVVGAVGVTAGTLLVSGAHRRWVRRPEDGVQTPADRDESLRVRHGVLYGLATGLAIAGYSVVDVYAVKHLTMTPILVVFLCDACRTVLFLPMALRDGAATRVLWRTQWPSAVAVGLLGPAAYMLVLSAAQLAPLSRVAPAREVSMLFAALLGGQLLDEGQRGARLLGALCRMSGVLVLAFG